MATTIDGIGGMMGVKNVLKTIAWPFRKLIAALFSPRGRGALRLAYTAMAKTPLGKIIVEIVALVQSMPALDSDAKRQIAIVKIIDRAQAAKLEWKESLIRTGIELAVQALKGSF